MSEALKPLTSEERLDITKQPPETCPLIDAVIATIKDANRSLKGYEKMDEEELKKAMWDVETDLDRCRPKGFKGTPPKYESPDAVLEAIREQCSSIRQWGQEWKDLAIHHETERDNALAEVETLTAENARLAEELREARALLSQAEGAIVEHHSASIMHPYECPYCTGKGRPLLADIRQSLNAARAGEEATPETQQ